MLRFKPDLLREAISTAGLTPASVASKAGLNPASMSRYLSGEMVPGSNALAALAAATNREIGSFFAPDIAYTQKAAPDDRPA